MSAGENLSNYQFYSSYDAPRESTYNRGVTRVLAYGPFGDVPVGAAEIKHAPTQRGYQAHLEWPPPQGERGAVGRSVQRRWIGGSFDKPDPGDVPYVSYLGMSHRNPSLLKGLIGAAVGQSGVIPHADKDLSAEGARISRGMNRRMGLKPHPENPGMESTFEIQHDPQGWINTIERRAENVGGQGHREFEEIPEEHVAQHVRAVFAKPPWQRPERKTSDEQLRLL